VRKTQSIISRLPLNHSSPLGFTPTQRIPTQPIPRLHLRSLHSSTNPCLGFTAKHLNSGQFKPRLQHIPSRPSASEHRTPYHARSRLHITPPPGNASLGFTSGHCNPALGFISFQAIPPRPSASLRFHPIHYSASFRCKTVQPTPFLGFNSPQSTSRLHGSPDHGTSPHSSASAQFTPFHSSASTQITSDQTMANHSNPSHFSASLHLTTQHDSASQSSASNQFIALQNMSRLLDLLQFHQLIFAPVLRPLLPHAMLTTILKDSLKDALANYTIIHHLEGKFKHRLVHIVNRL